MKLRTKLLLGIGLLLFAMVISMYIVPTYFIRRDVYNATDSIRDLLVSEHQQLVKSQRIWLQDILDYNKQNNDSLLFMLYEEPKFSSKISFTPENTDAAVWGGLAHVIGYDPTIGFVQAHNPSPPQTAVVSPGATTLYPIQKLSHEQELVLVSLAHAGQKGEAQVYIGVPLPKEIQGDKGYTLYALVDPEKAATELAEVNKEFTQLIPQRLKTLSETEQLTAPVGSKSKAFVWAIKVDLIRNLAPFYVAGLSLSPKGSPVEPLGMVRVDNDGNGYGILTKEAFSTVSLFDDANYFKSHPPLAGNPPLANGIVVVTVPEQGNAYLGNTLLLNNTYLTIASSLNSLAQELALSSNKMILLQVEKNFWLGFDGNGEKLSQETIHAITGAGSFNQQQGTVTVGKQQFYYSLIMTLEQGNLAFYDFHPMGKEESIAATLFALEDKLSNRISMQLSLIALGTMLLVLLFIGRLGLTIINPITKLASATQFVASGRYGEVVLPDMGDRKDEVAVLTRSFGNMVSGLQEREKIRGVLDKVVSKDVADEILRTQIHLGGEDRVVTMLFSDIRGFTHLSAHFPPQKTIQMLNECMTKVSRVIEGEGGVIDKYVGDEVMAIFGAPTTHPDHALRAISSGMLIIETLKKWNEQRVAANEPLVEMGIGIHTGLVVAGNMGAEDRLNYTVLGAHVNLAARLCEVAKPNQLIVSASTLAEPNIEASFYAKALPPISLKGFAEPVAIYEITGFKWEES